MANTNVGTRESIIKQVFESFKQFFVEVEGTAEIPTLSTLTKKDLKGMSKSDLKELFMESPKRVVEIAKTNNKAKETPKKKKTSFAAGSSVSQGLPQISKESGKAVEHGDDNELLR